MNRLLFTGLILLFMLSFLFLQLFEHYKIADDFDSLITGQITKTDLVNNLGGYNDFLSNAQQEGWLFYQVQNQEQLNDEFLFPERIHDGNKYYVFTVPSISSSEIGVILNYPDRELIEGLSYINVRTGKGIVIPLIKK